MAWDPGVTTSARSKLYIGTTATDPVSDTYIAFGHITDLGAFGRVYQIIKFLELDTGATKKFKGSYDDGDLNLKVGRDYADLGQAAALVALDVDAFYNFKVTLNDAQPISGSHPTIVYFKAQVTSFNTQVGGPNNVVMGDVIVAIQSGTITTIAPS